MNDKCLFRQFILYQFHSTWPSQQACHTTDLAITGTHFLPKSSPQLFSTLNTITQISASRTPVSFHCIFHIINTSTSLIPIVSPKSSTDINFSFFPLPTIPCSFFHLNNSYSCNSLASGLVSFKKLSLVALSKKIAHPPVTLLLYAALYSTISRYCIFIVFKRWAPQGTKYILFICNPMSISDC